MDISIFIRSVSSSFRKEEYSNDQLGSITEFNPEPDSSNNRKATKIAIVGVPEGRGSKDNRSCSKAPHIIREYLYKLGMPANDLIIHDFGNIDPGNTLQDTHYALSGTCGHLRKNGYVVIVLGGGQDLTHANYSAYAELERTVDMVSIDPRFDMGTPQDDKMDSSNYLSKIVAEQPN